MQGISLWPGVSIVRIKSALHVMVPAALPLSLYIHFPWCVRKCPYCDFNSHAVTGSVPEGAYVDALLTDLECALPLIWGRSVGSVFIGGGTPSLLSVAAISRLLDGLRMRLNVLPGAEITLEANPGTAEVDKFRGFHAAGVTRLSLGVQSFNRHHLKCLGRIHDAAEAGAAVDIAARIFDNFNIDLMIGLPQQTLAEALVDVDTALSFSPTHLSCYALTLEPNTPFFAMPPENLPDADVCADMQEAVETRLAAAGFEHYEISAFAQPSRRCHHNLNYWHFGDYLGIGAGAHSKLTLHDRIVRQVRHRLPRAYLDGYPQRDFLQAEHVVESADLPFEFMMNALRLKGGVPATLYRERTRQPLEGIQPVLQKLYQAGLLIDDPAHLQTTDQGRHFLNRLLQEFLPEK